MSPQLAALLMILVPMAGALLIPLINVFSKKAVPVFAVLAGFIGALIAVFLPLNFKPGVYFAFDILPGVFKAGINIDTLSIVPALIATWIGFLVLVYSLSYMKHEENHSRYYMLVLLFIASMAGMALADNFVTLFVFWEIMGVCSYLLIGFFYKDPKAAAAGVKAFIVTRIGDVGLFAAILILYTQTKTFAIAPNLQAAATLGLPILALVSFGFIFGAVGKSAQVPLHTWLPDAMEAPTTISALIHAATMVNAGVYLLARVYPILLQYPVSLEVVQWIGAITAITAALLAVFNNDLKRILAYSTVSQLGYMIFAIGAGGVFASQFHLLSHAIFKALLFLCAGAVIHEVGSRNISDMGGLKGDMPITAIAFHIGALALMGLPILNGFFSKDLILEQGLHAHAYWPLALAVTGAVLTAFYSFRTTAVVFWGEKRYTKHVHEAPFSMTAPLVLLAAASFVSWLLIGRLSTSWTASGLEGHVLNYIDLMKETFTSKAFLLSAGAIIIGYGLFTQRKALGLFIRNNMSWLSKFASAGFGFDIVYNGLISAYSATGTLARKYWENMVMDGLNKFTGTTSIILSSGLKKIQTGNIHWNLVYIVITFVTLLLLATKF